MWWMWGEGDWSSWRSDRSCVFLMRAMGRMDVSDLSELNISVDFEVEMCNQSIDWWNDDRFNQLKFSNYKYLVPISHTSNVHTALSGLHRLFWQWSESEDVCYCWLPLIPWFNFCDDAPGHGGVRWCDCSPCLMALSQVKSWKNPLWIVIKLKKGNECRRTSFYRLVWQSVSPVCPVFLSELMVLFGFCLVLAAVAAPKNIKPCIVHRQFFQCEILPNGWHFVPPGSCYTTKNQLFVAVLTQKLPVQVAVSERPFLAIKPTTM